VPSFPDTKLPPPQEKGQKYQLMSYLGTFLTMANEEERKLLLPIYRELCRHGKVPPTTHVLHETKRRLLNNISTYMLDVYPNLGLNRKAYDLYHKYKGV
jgi:hypothetical protein